MYAYFFFCLFPLFRKTKPSYVSAEPASFVLESIANGPIPTTANKFPSPRQQSEFVPAKSAQRDNALQQWLSWFYWSPWKLRSKRAKCRAHANNSRLLCPASCRSGENISLGTLSTASACAFIPPAHAPFFARNRCAV